MQPAAEEGSAGIWYAVLIGAVLLIATAIYAGYLYQQVEEWQGAANQLKIGQELLRADRDEILKRAREREVALSTLEAARDQNRRRLEGLESQRRKLQGDILKLTQTLARSERQSNGTEPGASGSGDLDRLKRDVKDRDADISRLETALAKAERTLAEQVDKLEKNETRIASLRGDKTDLAEAKTALEDERARLEQQLSDRRHNERRRQIIRGHGASLGDVKPYIAEVGAGDWSVIESWLALQLGRPMAIPDLSARDWSYEGARLLATTDGPPMVMLLYADAEERPVSLTITPDRRGEQPLASSANGGLNLLNWREERHAFFLAGQTEEEVLEAVAVDLLNEPPRLSDDAPVPISRYVRPGSRPTTSP